MSAFVVSDGTMDRVVSAILKLRENLGVGVFAGVSIADDQAGDKIGRKLYAMNIEAVAARYGETEPMPLYRWQPRGYKRPVEWFKAVQCLLYQCSEGNVPDSPLFKELELIKAALAHRIISELSAYKAAPWDIDRRDPRNRAA